MRPESRPPLSATPTGASDRRVSPTASSSAALICPTASPSIGGTSASDQYRAGRASHDAASISSSDPAASLRTPSSSVSGSITNW
jgi:hypothetical protein